MWTDIRRALVTVIAASLGLAGLSYAATGNVNPAAPPANNDVVTPPSDDGVGEPEATGEEPAAEEAETAGAPVRSTEGCGDGTYASHGAYVSSQQDTPRSEAAKSPCGKPVQSIHAEDEGDDTGSVETTEQAEPKKPKKDKGPEDEGEVEPGIPEVPAE